MSAMKCIVSLNDCERGDLQGVVKKLKGISQKEKRADILLKADDCGGDGWKNAKVAEALDCRTKTVENLRRHFVEKGLDETLDGARRVQPPVDPRLVGEQQTKSIAMRLGETPQDDGKWILRLLARNVVELKITDAESYETVRRAVQEPHESQNAISSNGLSRPKRTRNSRLTWKSFWTFTGGHPPELPVVGRDQQPVQFSVGERRQATDGRDETSSAAIRPPIQASRCGERVYVCRTLGRSASGFGARA